MKARSFRIYDRGMLMRVASEMTKLMPSEEHPLLVEVCDFKERKTRQQEKCFHAILGEVAEQVRVEGRLFTAPTWKTHFVRKYVGTNEVILPDGEIIQERKSTVDLTVEEYTNLIDKTLAELAMDYGWAQQEVA